VRLCTSRRSALADYEKVFGCPVEFDGETSEIWFDPAVLAYRSPRWDPDLLKLHEELAEKRLSGIERQDLIERIRRIFSQRLELEQCSLEDVARELKLPPRRLRFELMRANTSFSKLLNDFRFALARRLLRTTQEPIENIVYLTGFSEPSTFYRAFRRWAGMTPVQYRERSARSRREPASRLPA
jgi:AraC-like DNA-binding protein